MRITRRLAAGSVPAAVLTLLALAYIGQESETTNHLITTVLGIALILPAISLLFRRWLLDNLARHVEGLSDRQTRLFTNLLGAVLGVLVSLSSVGAGAIGVTVLLLLYPKLPVARLVGSDIAHAVPLTLIAGARHWLPWRCSVGGSGCSATNSMNCGTRRNGRLCEPTFSITSSTVRSTPKSRAPSRSIRLLTLEVP